MNSEKADISASSSVRVIIPTTSEFLTKWNAWIHGKVSKHYKRDKERIPDTAQRVRLRLLSKDFISRWFFKHLTDDLVDLSEAISMTGNPRINFSPRISPVHGGRKDPNSLWRISDILNFSNFDYERYFYSTQNHTIETDKFLRLLGYGSKSTVTGKWEINTEDYSVLESLYRQGRIKPAELTEHTCSESNIKKNSDGTCLVGGCSEKHFSKGYCKPHYRSTRANACSECEKGRNVLKSKGISLAHRWNDPEVIKSVSKLRWNDSQLVPFLRDWKSGNLIKHPPRYIMRKPSEATVDAGLLKYANMVIDNDVFNHFKSMIRSDDVSYISLDIKSDPDGSTFEKMYWETSEEGSGRTAVFIDHNAQNEFIVTEDRYTIISLIRKANLTQIEENIIKFVDLEESTISEVADKLGLAPAKINKIRLNAMNKIRSLA